MYELTNFNPGEMSKEQLDIIQSQIFDARVKLVENKLEEIKNLQDKSFKELKVENEELRNELEKHKDEMIKKEEVAINEFRLKSRLEGFVSLKDFGASFMVCIGSHTVGKLLKIIGLAQISRRDTIPYIDSISHHYAKSYPFTTDKYAGTTYRWNFEKCIQKIDKWLDENELKEEFYSISDEKAMNKLINEWYEKYFEQ